MKLNPKLQGSGIIECIPQKGNCPINCEDCFFNGGRSYLEPLEENTPHIPTLEEAKGRIVRLNDGNDSNNQRELVEEIAKCYDNYFFNTSIPKDLEQFSRPVVLTINPGDITDTGFHKLDKIPNNLMFVRIRTNTWNLWNVVSPAIAYYTSQNITCVLTFMAYYETIIPDEHKNFYEWKKRTTNSYWCLKQNKNEEILEYYKSNPYVDSCTKKGQYACKFCGVCLRTYFATKEKLDK